jgi:hypothetical protein
MTVNSSIVTFEVWLGAKAHQIPVMEPFMKLSHALELEQG